MPAFYKMESFQLRTRIPVPNIDLVIAVIFVYIMCILISTGLFARISLGNIAVSWKAWLRNKKIAYLTSLINWRGDLMQAIDVFVPQFPLPLLPTSEDCCAVQMNSVYGSDACTIEHCGNDVNALQN